MNEELQQTASNSIGVPFKAGFDERRNLDGRPTETEADKIKKKATKQLIEEYKEALGESLPLIKPVLIAKALEGDLASIKEINDRVMGKAEQKSDVKMSGDLTINVVKYGDTDTTQV